MCTAAMSRSCVISAVAAIIIGSFVATLPVMATGAGSTGAVQLAQGCSTYGPFATIRRANEIAAQAGSMGFSTQVFHNGDGYYVRIC